MSEFYFKKARGDSDTRHYSCYCKPCAIFKTKEYNQKNPEQKRLSNVLRKYGLTEKEYRKFEKQADGRCVICRSEFAGKEPCTDHCHTTGRVRGFLCSRCNSVLGYVDDNVDLLKKMIRYLK